MNKQTKPNQNQLLEDRVKKLEERVKKLEESCNKAFTIKSEQKAPIINTKPVYKKGEIEVTVNNFLQVEDLSGKQYKVGEEMIVKNNLVMGDKLLVSVTGENVTQIKVSQRAKRVREEGLVTVKDNVFYAVSKFSTHQLINYDIMTRGILKGFEVKLILPKDREKEATVALVDFVESSGGEEVQKNSVIDQFKQQLPNSNMRVVDQDDLV